MNWWLMRNCPVIGSLPQVPWIRGLGRSCRW
jgi:hypothetical protein